jgi:hypothetical protein
MIGGRNALLGAARGSGYGNWTGNYSDVSLLLRNGTPTLVPADESPTPKTLTVFGNASGSTTTFKYGGSALAFDGNGDSIETFASTDLQLGSGDFTIETWAFFIALDNNTTVARMDSGNGYGSILFCHQASGGLYVTSTGSSWNMIEDPNAYTGLTTNTWHHLALTRQGNIFRAFRDGTQTFTATVAGSIFQSSNIARIGSANSNGAVAMNGYIDDFRITKGIARYTTNFTPPPAQLPANITDDPSYNSVSLLLRGNGTPTTILTPFDESPTPKTLTVFGNASISTTTFKYGGSALAFDGSGDFFEITDTNNDFDLGGSNATLELWAYPMTASGFDVIIAKGGNTANFNTSDGFEYQLQYDKSANRFLFYFNNGAGPGGVTPISGGTQTTGSWYHLAIVTNTSNNIAFYINGINVASATSSIVKPATRTRFRLGTDLSGNDFTGYIDDLRITKGIARYTKNFLPPPAQLPAI